MVHVNKIEETLRKRKLFKQTQILTNKQTEKQTNKQTEKQTNIKAEIPDSTDLHGLLEHVSLSSHSSIFSLPTSCLTTR